jgi:hypothetical protein
MSLPISDAAMGNWEVGLFGSFHDYALSVPLAVGLHQGVSPASQISAPKLRIQTVFVFLVRFVSLTFSGVPLRV